MSARRGILNDAEDDRAVDSRRQLLSTASLPQCGKRRRRDLHRRRIGGDRERQRERIQAGGIETRMGEEQRVATGRDTVEGESARRVAARAPVRSAQPQIRPSHRRAEQAVVHRASDHLLGLESGGEDREESSEQCCSLHSRVVSTHGGPNAGGAMPSPVGLRIESSSNRSEGTTKVAVWLNMPPSDDRRIAPSIRNMPRMPTRAGIVSAVRERDAAAMSLNDAAVTPASSAPRIGSSWPSGNSLTASATGMAPPPDSPPVRIIDMTPPSPRRLPPRPIRRTTIA